MPLVNVYSQTTMNSHWNAQLGSCKCGNKQITLERHRQDHKDVLLVRCTSCGRSGANSHTIRGAIQTFKAMQLIT